MFATNLILLGICINLVAIVFQLGRIANALDGLRRGLKPQKEAA